MRIADAPADSAIFALNAKLQLPRCTRMTSPVSCQTKDTADVEFIIQNSLQSSQLKGSCFTCKCMPLSINELQQKYRSKRNLILRFTATIRRICNDNSSMVGMLLLWFQGGAKSSTNTNKHIFYLTVNQSWNFYLSNFQWIKAWIQKENNLFEKEY